MELPTLKPVVTISSPMEDKDEEDGCEETSIQDSEHPSAMGLYRQGGRKERGSCGDRPSFLRCGPVGGDGSLLLGRQFWLAPWSRWSIFSAGRDR